jgi:hypothetical protein
VAKWLRLEQRGFEDRYVLPEAGETDQSVLSADHRFSTFCSLPAPVPPRAAAPIPPAAAATP